MGGGISKLKTQEIFRNANNILQAVQNERS